MYILLALKALKILNPKYQIFLHQKAIHTLQNVGGCDTITRIQRRAMDEEIV